MFSKFAWNGITMYFWAWKKIHYLPPNIWNPVKAQFEMHPAPLPKIRWFLTNLNVFLFFICVPIYLFVKQVMVGVTLNSSQIIFLTLELFIGVHELPLFIKAVTNGHDLCTVMNTFVELDKYLRQNSMDLVSHVDLDSLKWYQDPIGIIFNGLAIDFFIFAAFAPALFCVLEVDSAMFILPEVNDNGVYRVLRFLVRYLICTLGITEIMCTIGFAHLTLVMLTLFAQRTILSLKFYQRPLIKSVDATKTNAVSKWGNARNQVLVKSKYHGWKDLAVYRLIQIQFRTIRQYTDVVAAFIMGPGFFIDVTANYVVVMMYDALPLFIYLIMLLLSIVVPVLIMALLPQAAKSNTNSMEMIKRWKWNCGKRRSWRKKMVNSLSPVGFAVGPFFTIKKSTTTTYIDQIFDYTISSILL